MVICLEGDADLHMAQLMPLPLTVSCFSKIQIGSTFLVLAHLGSPGKRAVKRVFVHSFVALTYLRTHWTVFSDKLFTLTFASSQHKRSAHSTLTEAARSRTAAEGGGTPHPASPVARDDLCSAAADQAARRRTADSVGLLSSTTAAEAALLGTRAAAARSPTAAASATAAAGSQICLQHQTTTQDFTASHVPTVYQLQQTLSSSLWQRANKTEATGIVIIARWLLENNLNVWWAHILLPKFRYSM